MRDFALAFSLAALGATAALGILLGWEPAWLSRWLFPVAEEVPSPELAGGAS